MKKENIIITLILITKGLACSWLLGFVLFGIFEQMWFPMANQLWGLAYLFMGIAGVCLVYILYCNIIQKFNAGISYKPLLISLIINVLLYIVLRIDDANFVKFLNWYMSGPMFILGICSTYLQFKYINKYFKEYRKLNS